MNNNILLIGIVNWLLLVAVFLVPEPARRPIVAVQFILLGIAVGLLLERRMESRE